nr:siphovirus ReqiPepy6 Gp37-like family protein [Arthrobacter sp. SDTb3-6]
MKSIEGTVRHNEISEATLKVPANHHRADLLGAQGARLGIKFRGETLMTGPIRQPSGAGPAVAGDLVYGVQSDFRLLHNVLGWPSPSKPLTQQGDDGAYYTIGKWPAETIVKDVVARNIADRLGFPLTIAPDQGRGAVMEASFRMHPLYDRLFPAVDTAGIGVTVAMAAGGLVLDVYVPRVYPNVLTEQSRVIQKWSFSGTGPEATRVVIGGQGQGNLRTFDAVTDAVRETAWGDLIEVFRDARDTADGTTYQMRGQETLDEAAPRGTLTVELAETERFRYGGPKGVHVGDLVTARVGAGITVTDVLREMSFSFDRDNGLKLSSTIGPKDDALDQLMQAITALARGVHDLKAGT